MYPIIVDTAGWSILPLEPVGSISDAEYDTDDLVSPLFKLVAELDDCVKGNVSALSVNCSLLSCGRAGLGSTGSLAAEGFVACFGATACPSLSSSGSELVPAFAFFSAGVAVPDPFAGRSTTCKRASAFSSDARFRGSTMPESKPASNGGESNSWVRV